jgi:hypothetical protein
MHTDIKFFPTLLIFAFIFTCSPSPKVANADNALKRTGVPARWAADYVHAVVNAGRSAYSRYIVERLGKKISLHATENWASENTLPLPAQFLALSSELSNSRGIGMRYRLMSLWPINPSNKPKTENEETGLQTVARGQKEPVTWVVKQQGIWYFQAVYPDVAVVESCVSCHNNHPQSPKKDFKVGDVMGGIIIHLPLGRSAKEIPAEGISLAPEVVADYVHTVLESDRTVYAKHVVNRLENKNIIHPTENWQKENTLLLPAQFLMSSADLINRKKLKLNFGLISLWPINSRNGPTNEFERLGLETVDIHPIRPYIEVKKMGRRDYFQAIYPDFAVTDACVTCHNAHPKSPRKDFKLDDVMGGIRVTFPVE